MAQWNAEASSSLGPLVVGGVAPYAEAKAAYESFKNETKKIDGLRADCGWLVNDAGALEGSFSYGGTCSRPIPKTAAVLGSSSKPNWLLIGGIALGLYLLLR